MIGLPAAGISSFVADRPASSAAGSRAASGQPPVLPPPASTVVTLGGSDAFPLRTYTAVQAISPVDDVPSDEVFARMLGGNAAAQSVAEQFRGVGAALLERFGAGFDSDTPAASGVAGVGDAGLPSSDNAFALEIRTVGGAVVRIVLGRGADGRGLSAQVQVAEGQVSDAERAAIAKLATAFQTAIDGLTGDEPQLNLDGLVQYDTNALASVDLKASVVLRPGQVQTLMFHADAMRRSVDAAGPAGNVSVEVDLSNPALLGNARRQQQALDTYLAQFADAAQRGKGDSGLMQQFEAVFGALHRPVDTDARPLGQGARAAVANKVTASMLTGLADFRASVEENPLGINPMRPGERETFSYTVSQQTEVGGSSAANLTVRQQQQSHLSASYNEPLSPELSLMLTTDPLTQNYYHYQIDDHSSSTTDVAYEDGELARATLTQLADQSTRRMKYVGGELVQDITTPRHEARKWNLLGMLKEAQRRDDHELRPDGSRVRQALSDISDLVLLQSNPGGLLRKPTAAGA